MKFGSIVPSRARVCGVIIKKSVRPACVRFLLPSFLLVVVVVVVITAVNNFFLGFSFTLHPRWESGERFDACAIGGAAVHVVRCCSKGSSAPDCSRRSRRSPSSNSSAEAFCWH